MLLFQPISPAGEVPADPLLARQIERLEAASRRFDVEAARAPVLRLAASPAPAAPPPPPWLEPPEPLQIPSIETCLADFSPFELAAFRAELRREMVAAGDAPPLCLKADVHPIGTPRRPCSNL